MSRPPDFDIVIVGAGIAGSALASLLQENPVTSGLRIALLESRQLPSAMPPVDSGVLGYDPRVSALTIASQKLLTEVGAWELIGQQRCSPYSAMDVWDGEGTGHIHFEAAEVNAPVLGHIVENRLVTASLMQQVRARRRIVLIEGHSLESLSAPANHSDSDAQSAILTLDNGEKISTSLVVGADGALSRVRSLCSFETREWDYGHLGIVATVQTEKPHQQTAWQRFSTNGPLAFLPLRDQLEGDHLCSIVWSIELKEGEQLMTLGDDSFRKSLGEAFEHRLGEIIAVSPRFAFPLRQRHAIDYVKPSVALVADAAHTIHPLAGQGINLGLLDVAALAAEIARMVERELELGSLSGLSRYQRRRKGENLLMMGVMEGFKRLFAEPALPARVIRGTGMDFVDRHFTLKHRIMKQAMGID